MKQERPKVNYTFVNPNTPQEIQKALKIMIVEKLTAAKAES